MELYFFNESKSPSEKSNNKDAPKTPHATAGEGKAAGMWKGKDEPRA